MIIFLNFSVFYIIHWLPNREEDGILLFFIHPRCPPVHYPFFISLTLPNISYCSIFPIYLSSNFKVQYYIIIMYIMLFLVDLDHVTIFTLLQIIDPWSQLIFVCFIRLFSMYLQWIQLWIFHHFCNSHMWILGSTLSSSLIYPFFRANTSNLLGDFWERTHTGNFKYLLVWKISSYEINWLLVHRSLGGKSLSNQTFNAFHCPWAFCAAAWFCMENISASLQYLAPCLEACIIFFYLHLKPFETNSSASNLGNCPFFVCELFISKFSTLFD